jgi:hypothetical protein
LGIGDPIGGRCASGRSGALQLATTVASVGPYELIIRRFGAHRVTNSALHTSPPTITVRQTGNPLAARAAGIVASAAGGISAWVIRS